MELTGFDPAVAAANGFDARTDVNGYQCSLPQGSPVGLCPEDFRVKVGTDGGISAFNTVYSTCGYSSLYWRSSKTGYETGYYINPSVGFAISHRWTLFFDTTSGPVLRDHGGLPPWGGRSWSASGSIGATGTYGSASGAVLLNNGGTCSSTGPTAT
jgi:hypothetical protein